MKTLKCSLLFSFICLLTISLNASVTTWIGGTGEWDNKHNWDTGAVPTLDDGVIINSGTVTVYNYGEANYVHLDGGNLDVQGTLYIVPENGWYGTSNQKRGMVIANGSSFNNYGGFVIQESWDFTGAGILLYCNGDMTNHTNGLIVLIGIHCTGIHAYTQSGTIYNYGEITMSTVNIGLFLLKPFRNYGDIEITSSSIGINNRESFYSSSSSTLEVNGRILNETGSTWNQYGSVEVHYTSTTNAAAIYVGGLFEIQNSGSLIVDGSHEPIHVTNTGTFRVRGDLDISNEKLFAHSLSNAGIFVNHQKGIINTRGYYGVLNSSGATMLNYGNWTMHDDQGTYYSTFKNSGIFSNRPKGKLYVEGRLNLVVGSTFTNQGHMFVLDDLGHVNISGQFNNTASLNDVHDQMSGINNNTSIRVHKVAGPWTEGVPVSNVLDIGSNPGATVLNWYTSPTGNTIAGTYNSSSNTFTPNANAVGLTSVFVRTRINSGGVTRRHELIIENGINSSPSPLHQPGQKNTNSASTRMTISPNPVVNNFSIQIEDHEGENLGFTIYNSMGQRVSFGTFESRSNSIHIPQYLPSGLYFVAVVNVNGTRFETKQIRILR